jgi:hypothetical protein
MIIIDIGLVLMVIGGFGLIATFLVWRYLRG